MNKKREIIIFTTLVIMAFISPWMAVPALLLMPGYALLKVANFSEKAPMEEALLLIFPLSVAYLSLASFLIARLGIGVDFYDLLALSVLPALVWLTTALKLKK